MLFLFLLFLHISKIFITNPTKNNTTNNISLFDNSNIPLYFTFISNPIQSAKSTAVNPHPTYGINFESTFVLFEFSILTILSFLLSLSQEINNDTPNKIKSTYKIFFYKLRSEYTIIFF